MGRRDFVWLTAVLAMMWFVAAAQAEPGVVLVHGKTGSPEQFKNFAEELGKAGFRSEIPEMCWSRERIYDRTYLDCLNDIDTAVQRLRTRGVTDVILIGMSLGANGVLGYGARHDDLKGVITLAPAHAPEFISQRPEISESLAKARELIAQGRGDDKATFADTNTRESSYSFTVSTTANIYISFFAPDSPSRMRINAAKLTAPLLLISGTQDPTQRGAQAIFKSAPPQALNRFVSVDSTHIGTPAAGREAVLSWLRELTKSP